MRSILWFLLIALTACGQSGARVPGIDRVALRETGRDHGHLDVATVWAGIATAAGDVCRQQPEPITPCEFRLTLEDNSEMGMNARSWVGADGTQEVAISTRLLHEIRSADELAFVFGHETAHSLAGHHLAFAPQSTQAGFVLGRRDTTRTELEADAIGTLITETAGYDSRAGAALLQRLSTRTARRSPSHPALQDRISVISHTRAAVLAGQRITLQ